MIIWTQEYINRLKELAASGIDYKKVALAMTREFKKTFSYHMVASAAKNNDIEFGSTQGRKKKEPSNKWRPEVVESLRAMMLNGYSGSKAAEELTDLYGETYTKNSVISRCKASRIKMFYAAKTNPKWSRKTNMIVNKTKVPKNPTVPNVKKKVVKSHTFDVSKSVQLIDIMNGQCRMPVSVRDFKTIGEMLSTEGSDVWYCGNPTEAGSYCNHCRELAYTPSRSVKINRLWSVI